MNACSYHSILYLQALSNIGAIFGSFVAVFLADRAGRKDTLIFSNTPTVCGYLFITCASYYQNADDRFALFLVFLYLGRFLTGVGAGWTSVVVPVSLYNITSSICLQGVGFVWCVMTTCGTDFIASM